MKTNHRRVYQLLIIALISFCVVMTGCSGGGSGGSGGSSEKPNPKLAIVNTSSTGTRKGDKVVITIGVKTYEEIDACGYQFALQYDDSKFSLLPSKTTDQTGKFNVFSGVDTNNSKMVRVMAVPRTKKDYEKIGSDSSKQQTINLVTLTFQRSVRGNGDFNIAIDNEGFPCIISVYDDKGNPVNYSKLEIDTTKKNI